MANKVPCPNCGEKSKKVADFCTTCGQRVTPEPRYRSMSPAKDEPAEPEKSASAVVVLVVILAACLGLAALGALALTLLFTLTHV